MPRLLEFELTRLLRSRLGIALVIAALIVVVVGLARIFGGPTDRDIPIVTAQSPTPVASADEHDDGPISDVDDPTPTPVTRPGRAKPESVAYAFAQAWVHHKNVSAKAWYDGLAPNVTKDLAEELEGADPARIPADHVLGRPSLIPVSEKAVNAVVDTDTGKLTLQLIAPDGHWFVNDIDWEAS